MQADGGPLRRSLSACSCRHPSNLISSPQKFGAARPKKSRDSLQAHACALVALCPATSLMAGIQVQASAPSGPVAKRQKTQSNGEKGSAPLVRQSKIFAPFRVSSCKASRHPPTANARCRQLALYPPPVSPLHRSPSARLPSRSQPLSAAPSRPTISSAASISSS